MDAKQYLGRNVRKLFKAGWFNGEVISVDSEDAAAAKPAANKANAKRKREPEGKANASRKKAAKTLFGIKYADGDTEDVYERDLKKLIHAYNAEDSQVKKALEHTNEFVGQSILFGYKAKVLEAQVAEVKLIQSKTSLSSSKIAFNIKFDKDKTSTIDEKMVRAGVKYFASEQGMQKYLAEQRTLHVDAAVAKNFDGQRFTGSVVSVEREVEKPLLSGPRKRSRLLYHIKYSDGDEEDVFEYELKEMKALAELVPTLDAALAKYKGTKVTHVFTDTAFDGEVVAVDLERKRKRMARTVLYRIKFSDGDEMDMYETELLEAAASYEKEPADTFNKRPLSERRPADTGKKGKGRSKKSKSEKPKKPPTKPTRVSARTAKNAST